MTVENNIDLMLMQVIQMHLTKYGPDATIKQLGERMIGLAQAQKQNKVQVVSPAGTAMVVVHERSPLAELILRLNQAG
ncbi:hypothetical protein [Endozoicomonas lisbonensis]|uniref:Uncharacterized protein n=1 Tax=Endozoicomonas lisbonensis TaxID=3120522 RepID=A0ABV2SGU4_9GAMM